MRMISPCLMALTRGPSAHSKGARAQAAAWVITPTSCLSLLCSPAMQTMGQSEAYTHSHVDAYVEPVSFVSRTQQTKRPQNQIEQNMHTLSGNPPCQPLPGACLCMCCSTVATAVTAAVATAMSSLPAASSAAVTDTPACANRGERCSSPRA